MGLLEKE